MTVETATFINLLTGDIQISTGILPLTEHRSFWGVGAAQSSSEAVLLHVFVTGDASGGGGGAEGTPSTPKTILRGYFFLESVSHYRLNPWCAIVDDHPCWSHGNRRAESGRVSSEFPGVFECPTLSTPGAVLLSRATSSSGAFPSHSKTSRAGQRRRRCCGRRIYGTWAMRRSETTIPVLMH